MREQPAAQAPTHGPPPLLHSLTPPPPLDACLQVVRKERAVGVVPTAATIYEVLEELAITVQVSRWLGVGGCWHGLMAAAHLYANCPAAPAPNWS